MPILKCAFNVTPHLGELLTWTFITNGKYSTLLHRKEGPVHTNASSKSHGAELLFIAANRHPASLFAVGKDGISFIWGAKAVRERDWLHGWMASIDDIRKHIRAIYSMIRIGQSIQGKLNSQWTWLQLYINWHTFLLLLFVCGVAVDEVEVQKEEGRILNVLLSEKRYNCLLK